MKPREPHRLRSLTVGRFSWFRLVRSTVLIYVLVASYVFFFSDRMIFLPPAPSYRNTDDIIRISVKADEELAALYLHNNPSDPLMVFIHGNAEDLGQIRPLVETIHARGYNLLAYDYRGYGTSDGKPGEKNAYADADAVYHYATEELAVNPERIVLYGRSVGSGSATYLAVRHPIGGLILEAPFISAFRVVLPFPIFPFDKFPNRQRIPLIKAPVLIIHGERDKVVPIHHGRKLFEMANSKKKGLWIESAGHNDLVIRAGDSYFEALDDFRDFMQPDRTDPS